MLFMQHVEFTRHMRLL